MLHRSFKAGKCKTSLKLAVARIKLLKNKRDVQLKQMKRDLAHLLETGQEKTAMIRVEHVVREEKTMAAYDFIDIYCELIVARLPIIESQKNCPIDLKEAVSTIIFASPRCADIPELLDVRKHFTAKYGKEFTTSSLELRPDCGVNRTVVENLSARAPNGETKLKILSGIAQEHNITWDPTAFGEKELKPPEDLLNGPRVTGTTSGWPAEPLPVHIPQNIQKPESSYVNNVTGSAQNSRISDQTNIRTPNTEVRSSTELRTSGGAAVYKEFEHDSSLNVNNTTSNRQNWNMEFKDATSAAQAAVESAERASLAARAAVELSSFGRVTRQYSGSHEPSMRDQQRYMNERENTQQPSMRDQQRYMSERESTQQPSTRDQQRYKSEKQSTQQPSTGDQQRYKSERESTQRVSDSVLNSQDIMQRRTSHNASPGSSVANIKGPEKSDIYSQAFSSDVEAVNNGWETKRPEESGIRSTHSGGVSNMIKEGTKRESRRSSSSFSDDIDDEMSFSNVQNEDPDDHLFVNTALGSMQSGTKQASFNDYPTAVFDESVSDDETNGQKYGLYNSSPAGNSPPRFSENLNSWSPDRHRGSSLAEPSNVHSIFNTESISPTESPEKINRTTSPSQSGDLPVTFDDSDGINSESEEERENQSNERTESSNQLQQRNSFTVISESTQGVTFASPKMEARVVNRTPLLHSSADDSDSDSDGAYTWRNQETRLNVGSESWKDHGSGDLPKVQPSAGRRRTSDSSVDDKGMFYTPEIKEERPLQSSRYSLTKDLQARDDIVAPGSPDNVNDSVGSSYLNYETGKELDFGSLRGGFRNKGYTRTQYRTGRSEVQQVEDTYEKSTVSPTMRGKVNPEAPYQKASSQRSRAEEMNLRSSKTTFDSDSDEAEVFPHHAGGSRGNPRGRFSGRTGESPAPSDISSVSTSTSGSRMRGVSEQDGSSSQNFHPIETSSNAQTQARIPGSRRSYRTNYSAQQNPEPQVQSRLGERPKLPGANDSAEHQVSKSTPQTEHYLARAYNSAEHQPPKSTPKTEQMLRGEKSMPSQSSAVEQSTPPRGSGTTVTSKQSSLNKESASRENSFKKASHVHPKLPDYDSFAAHFESLKSRR